MKIELTPQEARVIGCLLEKEVTTPEQYPLSINALTNGALDPTAKIPEYKGCAVKVRRCV